MEYTPFGAKLQTPQTNLGYCPNMTPSEGQESARGPNWHDNDGETTTKESAGTEQ